MTLRPPLSLGSALVREDRPLGEAGLRRSTMDLYGRPPFGPERERWTSRPRAELVEEALSTEEFWANWLDEQLYYFLLIDNFRPITEGVRSLPSRLARRELGIREALHLICLSSSFDRRNPGPDTFVTVVMEQILGLVAQKNARELEIGKKLYEGSRGAFFGQAGNSQADVVHIAVADERCLEHYLRREHERVVRCAPKAADVARWVDALGDSELSYPSILASWFSSPDYERSETSRVPLDNRLFVRALYVDLLGRLPDEDEAHRMRSALDALADPGPLRSLVARLLIDSGKVPLPERSSIVEPAGWIRETFERLLGRPPTTHEESEFVASLSDPACRPSTVLYAIVSHPEYQTW
jgi:hypothetical protein